MPIFNLSRNRDASPTIRGYMYQVDLTIVRWLDLQPGEVLELERGEDIDLVSKANISSGEEQERLLEQVKHREMSSLTLRRPEALAALANFYEHREANPGIIFRFRFTTNAKIGSEQNTHMLGKQPALEVWEKIRTGTLKEMPLLGDVVESIRRFLQTTAVPKGIQDESWQKFQAFVKDSTLNQLVEFIKAFEWSTGMIDAADLSSSIQQRLQNKPYDLDQVQAEDKYSRMVIYLLSLLSKPREKKFLTVEDRNQLLSSPPLSDHDRIVLQSLNDKWMGLEDRLRTLENHMEGVDLRLSQHDEQFTTLHNRYDQIVQNRATDTILSDWKGNLITISELKLESFKLGDKAATNFPYIKAPIQNIYSKALQILQDSGDRSKHAKQGILVTGESNAGKTRFSLEVLKEVFPESLLLQWRSDYTKDDIPPINLIEEQIILFLDDLQEYTSVQMRDPNSEFLVEDPHTITLRLIVETILQITKDVIIVAICRTENISYTRTALYWLLDRLTEVKLPTFDGNPQNLQAKQIFEAFEKQGTIHPKDWDGTLGSLILGLTAKNHQYSTLPPHAITILKSMKLLNSVLITTHTERRIRATSAGVFFDDQLRSDERIWNDAVDALVNMQFVREEIDYREQMTVLNIRKDTYFEKVITDYPNVQRPLQVKNHLINLQKILKELKDTLALCNMSISFYISEQDNEALSVIDETISFVADDDEVLTLKALYLSELQRWEEALDILDHILTLYSDNILAWELQGRNLYALKRYEESLKSLDRVLDLNANDAAAWNNKGACLIKLGRYEEGCKALDRALDLEPNNINAWNNKGAYFSKIGKHEEALEALDHALSLDPTSANHWARKGIILVGLKKTKDALAACNAALSFDSANITALYTKGFILHQSGDYKEALVAFEQFVKIDANNAEAWDLEGLCLSATGQDKQALIAFEQALLLKPTNPEYWAHKAAHLGNLGRYNECLAVLNQALAHASSNAPLWNLKGLVYFSQGQLLDALAALDTALSLDPADDRPLDVKAEILRRLGRHDEADEILERVITLSLQEAISSLPKELLPKELLELL